MSNIDEIRREVEFTRPNRHNKEQCRQHHKLVVLISHIDELQARLDSDEKVVEAAEFLNRCRFYPQYYEEDRGFVRTKRLSNKLKAALQSHRGNA